MRPIKFRAWDNEDKKYFTPASRIIAMTISITLNGEIIGHPNIGEMNERFELEQFTGLTDKNGVEIYEGDIIYTSFNKSRFLNRFDMYLREIDHIVKWEGVSWNIPNIELEFRESLCTAVYNSDKELPKWEVIGNIHENNFESL